MSFPAAPFERILKRAGAKRVSQAACEEFARVIEEKMLKVAEEAVLLAKHAGRKTIKAEDIEIAAKKVMGK